MDEADLTVAAVIQQARIMLVHTQMDVAEMADILSSAADHANAICPLTASFAYMGKHCDRTRGVLKMVELENRQVGDYLLPDLGLGEEEQQPLGKYGMLRREYLEKHRPGLYTRLLLGGMLMEHLHEIDHTATERINYLMPSLAKQNGATEELKVQDQMAWGGLMNNLWHQVDEMILDELIYT